MRAADVWERGASLRGAGPNNGAKVLAHSSRKRAGDVRPRTRFVAVWVAGQGDGRTPALVAETERIRRGY